MSRHVIHRTLSAIAVAALVAVSVLVPATTLADGNKAVIKSHTVQGKQVVVNVENKSQSSVLAKVQVRVKLDDGRTVVGFSFVSLQSGETKPVSLGFLRNVDQAEELKISEDHDPF